jgi:hypothetical protein
MTNVFGNPNKLNVLGLKHLVDIEGVTGSIPVAPTTQSSGIELRPIHAHLSHGTRAFRVPRVSESVSTRRKCVSYPFVPFLTRILGYRRPVDDWVGVGSSVHSKPRIITGHCRGLTATTAVTLHDRRQGPEFTPAFGHCGRGWTCSFLVPVANGPKADLFTLDVPLIVCSLEEGRTDDF